MSRESGGGKFRPGRERPSTKPYERRRSWLGRVAETVTGSVRGLLSPVWNSSAAGSSVPEEETSERQTEHSSPAPAAAHQHQITVPVVRKGEVHRLPMTTSLLQTRTMPFHSTAPFHPRPAAQSHNMSGFQPFTDQLHGMPHDRVHSINQTDDARSDISMMSTAVQLEDTDYQDSVILGGLNTSLATPHAIRSPYESMNNISNISQQERHSNSFDEYPVKLIPHSSRGRPSFKPSLFHSAAHNESSFFNEPSPTFESSFYEGKTTYGGSAARRQIHARRSDILSSLGRNVVRASPAEATVKVTSNVTNRILNALEHMAAPNTARSAESPDIAARVSPIGHNIKYLMKTPLSGRSGTRSPLSVTPRTGPRLNRNTSDTRSPLARNSGFQPSSAVGPPQTALNVSRVADLGQNNQHLIQIPAEPLDKQPVNVPDSATDLPVARVDTAHLDSKKPSLDATSVVITNRRSSAGSDSVDNGVVSDIGTGGGKIKRERSMHFSSKGWQDDDMPPPMPDLKTDFTLPIKQMPTFGSLSTKMPVVDTSMTSTSVRFTFSSPIKMSHETVTVSSGTKGTNISNALSFTFASPVTMSLAAAQPLQHKAETAIPYKKPTDSLSALVENDEFKFGGINPIHNASGFTFGGTEPRPKTGGLKFGGTEMTSPPPETSGSLGPCKSSELKFGSVMDILGGKPSQQSNSSASISGQKKLPSAPKQDQSKSVSSQPLPVSWPADVGQGHISNGFHPAAVSFTALMPASSGHAVKSQKPFPTVKPSSWECDTCLVQNNGDANFCVACNSAKPGSSSLNFKQTHDSASNAMQKIPQKASLSDMFRKPEGNWSCEVCLVQNKADQSKCIACGSANSSNNSTTPAPINDVKTTGGSLSDMFRKPATNWDCDVCLVQNKADQSKCIACGSANTSPISTTTPPSKVKTPGGSLSDMFRKPATNWDCDVCLVQNQADQSKCIACGSVNTATGSSKTASPVKTTGSLLAQFSRPSGTWECDSCMLMNKAEDVKCVACSVSKPGANALFMNTSSKLTADTSSKPPSTFMSSGFSFGSNATPATSTTSTPGFTFGSTTTASTVATTTPGFTFGSNAIPTASSPTTAGFSFGSNTKTTASITAAPGFTFGSNSTPTATVTTAGGFTFGSNTKTTAIATTAGGFTFGSNSASTASTTTTSAGLMFGSNSTPTTSVTTVGGFTFGSNATSSSAPTGGFTFGSQSAPAPGGPLSTGVALGSTATVTASSLKTSGFNFNATAANSSTPATASTGTGVMAGGFSFGSTTDKGFGAASTTKTNLLIDGFNFGTKTTTITATASPATTTTVGGSAPAGFTFGAASTQKVGSVIPGGFTFGATKSVLPSVTQSGVMFGSASSSTTEQSTGGFTFHKSNHATSTPSMMPASGAYSTTSLPGSTAIRSNTVPLAPSASSDSSLLSKPATSSAAPGFNFNMAPSFNFAASAAPVACQGSSIFQFGSSQISTPAALQPAVPVVPTPAPTIPTFPATPTQQFNNFSTGASVSDNPFSVASSGSGRVIKKAVRKVRK